MDSIGRTNINGVEYILHRVDPKETLFGLARRYGVSISQIEAANDLSEGLKIGLIVRIPTGNAPSDLPPKQVIVAPIETSTPVADNPNAQYHQVQKGETLYAISKKYPGATVENLIKWNNIGSAGLAADSKIIVGFKSDKQPVTTKPTTNPVPKPKENPTVVTPPTANPNPPKVIVKEPPLQFKEASREMLVQWDGNGNLEAFKKIAYHNTFPVGSIIKIQNPENKRVVFVKVVGKIPDGSYYEGAELVVSKSAAELIDANGQRFRGLVFFGTR